MTRQSPVTRCIRVLLVLGSLVLFVIILALFGGLGRDAVQDAQPAGSSLTVEQIRAAFLGAGFQVDEAHSWTWISPPVTTLQIYDQSRGRVLMALVYADAVAAQTERFQAQVREPEEASIGPTGYGPHLLPGYGKSIWRANVAVVQATQAELDHLFPRYGDRGHGVFVDTIVVREPDQAVDLDFQQALDNSVVSL